MSTFRLGIFIVATLTILGAAVFLIGNNQMRFHSTFHVRADFRNVSGLVNGADVRVGGVHMGTVRRINLPDRLGCAKGFAACRHGVLLLRCVSRPIPLRPRQSIRSNPRARDQVKMLQISL